MVSVSWSPDASADLQEIQRYIARDSREAAERLATRIVQSTRRLEQFPRSGRMTPEHGRDDVRELIVDAYRVIYIIDEDVVRIVAVQHSARRLGDIPGV